MRSPPPPSSSWESWTAARWRSYAASRPRHPTTPRRPTSGRRRRTSSARSVCCALGRTRMKIRAALVQVAWTGDKDSMIDKHVRYIKEAAAGGAQAMCLQELFYGPYFCQVQDTKHYAYTERIPEGPTTKLMQELAKQHGIVLVVPMYEEDGPGVYYNTAA